MSGSFLCPREWDSMTDQAWFMYPHLYPRIRVSNQVGESHACINNCGLGKSSSPGFTFEKKAWLGLRLGFDCQALELSTILHCPGLEV